MYVCAARSGAALVMAAQCLCPRRALRRAGRHDRSVHSVFRHQKISALRRGAKAGTENHEAFPLGPSGRCGRVYYYDVKDEACCAWRIRRVSSDTYILYFKSIIYRVPTSK